jgi:MFS family permease
MTPRDVPPTDPDALRRTFFRVFPAVGLAIFGAALDQTIIAAALPAIARSLGDVERVSWVVVVYLVATTLSAPVYGRLGDAFGRRRMLLVALGMYAAGACIAATAPVLDVLALGRLVQGFGGGGLISLSVALIAEYIPPRERGRFQAWIAAIFATASAFGPVAGGLMTEWLGWRSVFLLQPPLSALAAFFVATRLRDAAPGSTKGFAFDWMGLLLFTLFVAPALLALDQARKLTAGPLVIAAVCAAVAVAALVLLLRQERRARDPLLPLEVLGNASVWRANLMTALVNGAFLGTLAFLPIYFAAVRGLSPAATGIALLPLAVAAALGATFSGRVLSRTGYTMRGPAAGLSVAALLLGVVALQTGEMPVPLLAGLLGLVSIGMGTSFPMVQVVVQMAVGRERLGSATASVQFARSLGAATGTAVMGAVLFGALVLQGDEAARLFVALVNAGPAALNGLDQAAQQAFRAAVTGAFSAAFLCAAIMTAVGAWLCTRVPLQRV